MDKPTMEEIERALAYIDEWGNGGPGAVMVAAYRESHARAQALQMYLDAETEERRKWAVHAEMLDRQYQEVVSWNSSRGAIETWFDMLKRHAAEREGK